MTQTAQAPAPTATRRPVKGAFRVKLSELPKPLKHAFNAHMRARGKAPRKGVERVWGYYIEGKFDPALLEGLVSLFDCVENRPTMTRAELDAYGDAGDEKYGGPAVEIAAQDVADGIYTQLDWEITEFLARRSLGLPTRDPRIPVVKKFFQGSEVEVIRSVRGKTRIRFLEGPDAGAETSVPPDTLADTADASRAIPKPVFSLKRSKGAAEKVPYRSRFNNPVGREDAEGSEVVVRQSTSRKSTPKPAGDAAATPNGDAVQAAAPTAANPSPTEPASPPPSAAPQPPVATTSNGTAPGSPASSAPTTAPASVS
jgi:hypothetical protein